MDQELTYEEKLRAMDLQAFREAERKKKKEAEAQAKKEAEATCLHDWVPTLQGGDTYRCKKCGKEIDMTEDEEP